MKILLILLVFTFFCGIFLNTESLDCYKKKRTLDWRKKGAVTEVKEENKTCNSSYAFAAIAALESRIFIQKKQLNNLSVQNVIDCSEEFGNNGCQGGSIEGTYEYIVKNEGINTANDYPFEGETKECRFKRNENVAKIEKYYFMYGETELKRAVEAGPVAVAIDADHPSFINYTSGIYKDYKCGSRGVNHAIAVVGYGTDDKTNEDYWIMKNSWGPKWGENGFMRMVRGIQMCNIGAHIVEPIA